MCLTPSIINNPVHIKNVNQYPCLLLNSRYDYYTKHPLDLFDFKRYNRRALGVTIDNIDRFQCFNAVTGESIPMFIQVPCGHCPECRKSKFTEIYNRMLLEQYGRSERALFFTLTYSDENLPESGVSVCDVKLFFNRFYTYLRRLGYKGAQPRHIYFSEYSPKGRAHYHGLIYGLQVSQLWPRYLDFTQWFRETWGKGHVHIKHFDPHGFKYIAKYILKEKSFPSGKCPNFWFGSRVNGGIGSRVLGFQSFIDNFKCHMDSFVMKVKIDSEVHTVKVPRFLRDKLLPTISRTIPDYVKKGVQDMVFCLSWMRAKSDLYPNDIHPLLEKYDFVFPPDLAFALPWYREYWSYNQVPNCLFHPDVLKYYDDEFIVNRYETVYREILHFLDTPAYKVAMESYYNRDRILTPYRQRVRDFLLTMPTEDERLIGLNRLFDEVLTRDHFC